MPPWRTIDINSSSSPRWITRSSISASTGTVETWNPGARRIFLYEPGEIIGRSGTLLFTPEDNLEGVPEHELRFATQSGRAEDSRWHIRKDGSRFWANGVMVGLRDEAGTVTGVAKIIRDDTELKRAEDGSSTRSISPMP